jgi:predicted peptidase
MEAMMEKARTAYTVDAKRVTLTGLSMGGYATWIWGPVRKDVFAAFMPVCGGGSFADIRRFCPKAGEDVFPSIEERGKLLADRPVWAFHGKDDDVVPPFRTRQMVRAVEKAGGKPRLTEYPDTGHNSWDAAYGDPEAIAWLLAQKLPD